jgi:nitroreductase
MNEILKQLQNRNSAPRLTEPGPDPYTLEQMFVSALRAPDHAWLQPWRFIVIEGEARAKLGEVFLQALLAAMPDADEVARSKALTAPLRAPLLVVAVCKVVAHPKVPREEQLLSTGCAVHSMLLAAESQGYAGIWRTGGYTTDEQVLAALGLADGEEIVGFVYFGTRDGKAKTLPAREVENHVSYWQA